MASATATSRAAGGLGAVFTEAGRAAMNIGRVQDLYSDDDKEAPPSSRKGSIDSESMGAPASKRSRLADGKTPSLVEQVWFDRDSIISAALRSHQTWMRPIRRDLEAVAVNTADVLEGVPNEVKDDVKNEIKLCQNRVYALKLVLGAKASIGVWSSHAHQRLRSRKPFLGEVGSPPSRAAL